MRFHIVEITKDKLYAFSIWDIRGNLMFLYTGNRKYIAQRVKEFSPEPSSKKESC